MFKTSDKRMSMSFRSYVGLEDTESKTANGPDIVHNEQLNARLLPGEAVAAEAQKVLMYAPISEKQGKSGILTVTNFKLSFITADEAHREERGLQENLLLGDYDICLSNVDEIHQLTGDKRRKIVPGSSVSGKIKGLYIVCKNMKVIQFSFKFSPVGHAKTLTTALLLHAYPKNHDLLFAYDYREPYYSCERSVAMFRDPNDWSKELNRTGAVGWKLSAVNQNFQLSTSLPQWLVVPAALVDCQLMEAARHFRSSRPPVWSWSSPHGAALVRMADLQPSITDRMQENVMLENVRKSHPKLIQPHLMELSQDVPTPKDVHTSYCKLRDLCTPDNVRQFWIQDNHFLSQVEGSRWLHYVSACLGKSSEAALALQDNITVVLQEADGRDLSCIVSTLTQMLIDKHFRTVVGFQSLLQKEWVALGHPFCSRLGHILNPEIPQSPLLLLFLDCVWQLLHQFPSAFEFTETYLTTLWDCAHITIFDTFLFDCERDRYRAVEDSDNPLRTLRTLWDWGEQFLEKDIALFHNPFFDPSKHSTALDVHHSIPNLALWSQCYFRWIPLLEIKGGGPPQTDLGVRALQAQTDVLREQLNSGEHRSQRKYLGKTCLQTVSSFYPFSSSSDPTINPTLINSALALNSNYLSNEALLDSQSLLNAPD